MTQCDAGRFPGIRTAVIVAMIVAAITLAGGSIEVEAGPLRGVQPDLKPLDLSRPPSVEELMAAGQLGGRLYPTADIVTPDPKFPRRTGNVGMPLSQLPSNSELQQRINLSFGSAIQEWNRHHYAEAVTLFKKHLADFPDSPWAAESLLHLGCDAFYHGRSTEAETYFREIMDRNRNNRHEGGVIMTNKARLRLGVLKAARNNTAEATELFALLIREGTDWRDKTYASQWLQRLTAGKHAGTGPLSCGTQALAYLFTATGLKQEAGKLANRTPETTAGFSFADLIAIAAEQGVRMTALRLTADDLPRLALPVLVHIPGRAPGDSGHYWVLERREGDRLTLFDPQGGRFFIQTEAEFSREWSGAVLVREEAPRDLPGVRLAASSLAEIVGGCCGVPKPESDLGQGILRGVALTGMDPEQRRRAKLRLPNDSPEHADFREEWTPTTGWGEDRRRPHVGDDGDTIGGAPAWWVNPVNMNLLIRDTPLRYQPAVGPPLRITLTYNSQSAIAQHEPFGSKWQFNYGSYLVVDTGGEVTIFMADGRRDVYTPNPAGGYLPPYQVHNTLVKLAENRFELRFPDGRVDLYAIPSGTSSLQPFMIESRDAYGNKLTFTYDSQIHLTTITDAVGKLTSLTYNGDGLVTRVTDPFGRYADFAYGSTRTLVKITDTGGYVTDLIYDAALYPASLTIGGATWRFSVEPADGINNSADSYPPPGGVMWENYRITVTNPQGGKEEFYYNGYTGGGWHIQPRDYVAYYPGYDGAATPKTDISFSSTSGQRAEISAVGTPSGRNYFFSYDANGDLRINWDAIQFTYNSQGRLTTRIDPRRNMTTWKYAPNGVDPIAETNDLGTISYTYNASHDVTSVTDRLNHTTTYAYDTLGRLTTVTDPLGTVTGYEYDAATYRPLKTSIAGVTTGSFTHDPLGRVRAYTDRAGITLTYDYNALDDVTRITYPDGTFVAITYSPLIPRLVTAVTDRAGATTNYAYDRLNRLISLTRPDGSVTTYERDANGNVTAYIDANGNRTSINHDLDNRPIQERYPDGTSLDRIFQYAGVVATVTRADTRVVNFTYDEAFNLTSVSSGSGAIASYLYDPHNRRVAMTDSRGATTYTYDAASRLTSISGPGGNDTITLTYDSAGRRVGIDIAGRAVTYAYDPLGRVTGVTEGSRRYILGYPAANPFPNSLTRPNGSSGAILRDALNRPYQSDNKQATGSLINRFITTYAAGRELPVSEAVTGGAIPPAVPDAVQAYGYDTMNQPVSGTVPDRTYAWDRNGNLTAGYTIDGAPFTATYDDLNRLVVLTFTDTGAVVRSVRYEYDGDGRLAAATETADGVTVRDAAFVRLGPMLLRERDGSGAVVRDYTWSGVDGGWKRVLGLRQGGADYDYLFDNRGRIAALINGAQTVVAAYGYDAFGAPFAAGSITQPLRSSGADYDERIGLYHFSSRFYLPNPGVMMSRRVSALPESEPVGPTYRPLRLLEMRPTGGLPDCAGVDRFAP